MYVILTAITMPIELIAWIVNSQDNSSYDPKRFDC